MYSFSVYFKLMLVKEKEIIDEEKRGLVAKMATDRLAVILVTGLRKTDILDVALTGLWLFWFLSYPRHAFSSLKGN